MKFDEIPEPHQNLLGNLFDPGSPASLASLLPPGLGGRLLDSLYKDPDLFPLLGDEDGLISFLSQKYRYLTPATDCRLRMSFWLEYERAIAESEKMVVRNVHSLVCDDRTFYRLFATCPGRTAFLLCRPVKYEEQVKEMLAHGLRRYRQILDRSVDLPNGKIDHKLLAIQVKIVAMMDMRLHGAPTQKVQQLNVNVDAGSRQVDADTRKLVAKGDMASIQHRLLEIEKQMGEGPRQELPVLDAELVIVGGKDAGKTDAATDPADSVRAPGKAEMRQEE